MADNLMLELETAAQILLVSKKYTVKNDRENRRFDIIIHLFFDRPHPT